MPKPKLKKIVKVDGSKQAFSEEKVVSSLLQVGVPGDIAKDIACKIGEHIEDGTTTREIRTLILKELEQRNPEWYDKWIYYDRIVKKRVTYEQGKFIEVKKGNLYLGREVRDIGQKGLTDVAEVQAILRELEEDLKHGLPKKRVNSRTFVLYMAILKTKKMKKADKEMAIAALNEFRQNQGWEPYTPKKPL